MLALIALLPFLGFLVNASVGRRLSRAVSGGVACAAIIGSFLLTVVAVSRLLGLEPDVAERKLGMLPGAEPIRGIGIILEGVRALGRSWDVTCGAGESTIELSE